MKKTTKIILLITVMLFCLGLSMTLISWYNGFRTVNLFPDEVQEDDLIDCYDPAEGEVTSVVVKAHAGNVVIMAGEEFAVTKASETDCYTSTLEDGVWTVELVEPKHEKGNHIGDFYLDRKGVYLETVRSTVYITIPATAVLEQFAIDNESGNITVNDGPSCATLNMTMETGTIDFYIAPTAYAFISNQAGHINGILAGKIIDYHLILECDLGRGKVGSHKLSPMLRDEYSGSQETKIAYIDSGSGETNISFSTGKH